MQLIEFIRVAGATEVEVLIPMGGYSRNEQRCSSNVTFGIGTPRIALQKAARIDFLYSWRATASAPEEDEATINLEIDFVEVPG